MAVGSKVPVGRAWGDGSGLWRLGRWFVGSWGNCRRAGIL